MCVCVCGGTFLEIGLHAATLGSGVRSADHYTMVHWDLYIVLTFRLVELTSRHRQGVELESERSKQSQSQLEKTQVARERAHKQRVKGLEEQVTICFWSNLLRAP